VVSIAVGGSAKNDPLSKQQCGESMSKKPEAKITPPKKETRISRVDERGDELTDDELKKVSGGVLPPPPPSGPLPIPYPNT
jgi:bacteriocin-like protein